LSMFEGLSQEERDLIARYPELALQLIQKEISRRENNGRIQHKGHAESSGQRPNQGN
jgi:hypothetical protein